MFLSAMHIGAEGTARLHPSLVCLAGLSAISTLALGLSLFTALGWETHALLFIGALVHLLGKTPRKEIRALVARTFEGFSPLQYCLLAACIGMVLLIGAHDIIHPDTLHYHADSILLFQRYKSVPGIANIRPELGFQCGWFAALAILNPTPWYHLIFLNGAVLCWFFIFVLSTWDRTWPGWLLLAYTLWSWVQVRLTAASASPDFIVTLYSWAAIYSFIRKEYRLAIFFCLAAMLTKASAMVLLLLAATAFLYGKRPWRAFIYSCIALIILFIKNAIASGYILYPASWPDLLDVDWKVPLARLHDFQLYISHYATIPFTGPMQPWDLPWAQRVAAWWSNIQLPDRLLLLAILAGLLIHLVMLMIKGKRSTLLAWNKFTLPTLVVAFTGSVIWLCAAPSPRFGTGFLVPFLYLLFYHLPQPASKPTRLLSLVAGCCLFMAVSAYTVYRCIYFLTPSELLMPSGIAASAYEPIDCGRARVDLLHDSIDKAQSAGSGCETWSPRGRTVEKGFIPR
ncbi:MAG TPA: hypothetical protein VHC48_15600 [Puia sp.]|nr:hypothetical protein [Puia sp.]